MHSPAAASPDRWLQVREARLCYRDEGRGFPLVLLHGWALDLDMWQPQVDALAGRLRLVRLDRRGFGRSSGPPSLAREAEDVEALVEHLRLQSFAVLGMSQAGRVALQLGVGRLSTRLAALILDGSPHDDAAARPEGADEIPLAHYRELVKRGGSEAFNSVWRSHPFMRLHTSDASMHALLAQMAARSRPDEILAPAAESSRGIVPVDPSGIRTPALVVNGELDSERRRAMGDALAGALPRAERALIPRAGHLPNLDNPRAYNDVLTRFLVRHVPLH